MANIITVFGMAGVAVYCYGYMTFNWPLLGSAFTFAFLTDLVDGWYARKFNKVTVLGKVLDPVRDRMILFAFLGQLFFWGKVTVAMLPWIWAIGIFECSIWNTRFIAKSIFHIYVGTNVVGKFRQIAHVTIMLLALIELRYPSFSSTLIAGIQGMAVASFMAFSSYLYDAWASRRSLKFSRP